jgi:2-methylcitrate dehydratase PrpD
VGPTAAIVDWIVHVPTEDIPQVVLDAAAESCLDLIGVTVAGTAEAVGATLRDYMAQRQGAPEATVLGSSLRASLLDAALANGTAAHALDFDDVGGFGHPSAVLFSSLLPLAEHLCVTGRDLLTAYIVGCEVGIALQEATKYRQMERGLHSTPVIGRIAAVSACSRLAQLNEDQSLMALGIVATSAGGLVANFGTMTKSLHVGMAARDAIFAVQLAQRGWTACDGILEHPQGFVNAVMGAERCDLDSIASALGKPFRTHEVLTIKKYPCCLLNHPLLDAVLGITRTHGLTCQDIVEVEFDQNPSSPVMLYDDPADPQEAMFSVRYNVAAALVDREVTVGTFSMDKLRDPRIKEAMSKVKIRVTPEAGSVDYANLRPQQLRVTLRDGRSIRETTRPGADVGDRAIRREAIINKFKLNCARRLTSREVARALDSWRSVLDVADVSEAIMSLCPGPEGL